MHASGGPRPPAGTLSQLFFEANTRFDKPDAMLFKADGVWNPISHRTVEERARRVTLGLRALGVNRGDRVAILSENRPEWGTADFGCVTGGIIDVPVYPTLPAEQIPHILNDSGCVVVFVSNETQAAKIRQIRASVPSLRHVVSFDAPAPPGTDLTFAQILDQGAASDSADATSAWRRDALAIRPDDVATIIYTSGTTGNPKGVMLTHDNIASNVAASRTKIPFGGDDLELSFLPLSHIFQRMFDYLAWATGTTIAYAENIDAVAANMGEVRPTIMCAVPRLYEKMYARVLENALRGGALKQRIFFWSREVAARWSDTVLAGKPVGPWLQLQYAIASKLVFSKLRARVGGRLRYFVSGGAPLAPDINKFFHSAGLMILEGYGLTETSPVMAVNTPEYFRIGTVGHLIEGVEVKIAADGEILTRGPNVMKGYYNNPDATREAIDAEGWFHTGDIGTIEDGYLRITDRKKDLIVTAGGKNIAPQPIENRAKMSKFVTEAVMIGDKRKYPIMLVVPNFGHLEEWARAEHHAWDSRATLLGLAAVEAKMDAEVRATFDGLAQYEMPKKIALLEHEFSIEKGELTPSMKVKRRVIDAHYKSVIDTVYGESAAPAI